MIRRVLRLPLEAAFKLAGVVSSLMLAAWRFATSNFFIVFAFAVFVLYVLVFRSAGRQ